MFVQYGLILADPAYDPIIIIIIRPTAINVNSFRSLQ